MAQSQSQRSQPQSKDALLKSYQLRLKQDTKAMQENFLEILKLTKINTDLKMVSRQLQGEREQNEMHVRASNIVRAGESLLKLISDIKQYLILNDFPAANQYIADRTQFLSNLQEDVDNKIIQLRDELAIDLYEVEEEFYSSKYK